MSFGVFLGLILFASSAAWGSWVYVLLRIDPFEAGSIGLILFYLTLLVSLIGTITLLGLLYRVVIRKREFLIREARTSFRHGILLSTLGVLCLFLSSRNWLHWWSFFIALLVIGALEYLFLLIHDR